MTTEPVAVQTAPTAIAPVEARRRRLTVVMLVDVVGYSRLMGSDEEGTLAGLKTCRELIEVKSREHHGRIVNAPGDSALVEFGSAVDAVRCALDIQRGLAARQTNEKDRIQLRIGINTGDVLVDQRDIYGNSVNIAARLEALASPGTVFVSQSIYDQTRAQPEFFFADRGMHRVKNIQYPIHVYEVGYERIRVTPITWLIAHWTRSAAVIAIGALVIVSTASVLMFRPVYARTNSIVVLPFKNIDGNTTDDYLADAITYDLTTELSRLRRAWVIASGTAFTYKYKPNDPRQVGRELQVRYALEGSVRRTGPVVQVNAQLIDTKSGINLWAYSYETSSLLDLQDHVLARIATSLNDEVTIAGARHEVGTLAADHNPLDERMRAMATNIGFLTAEKTFETRQHAETGLKADPDNARLLGLLASVLTVDVVNGWNGAGTPEVDRAETLAKKAISLDRNTPFAYHAHGWVHRLRGEHQKALDAFNEAVKIDPNFAEGYAQMANEKVFLGKAKDAIPLTERAIQLSPNDPYIGVIYWIKGRAHFTLGDYPNAIKALEEAVRARPSIWYSRAWLVAAYALANRDPEARQALEAFKQTNKTQSEFDWIAKYYKEEQYKTPALQTASAELLNGLRKAGLK